MTAGPSGVNETLSERCFRPFASKTRALSGLAILKTVIGGFLRDNNIVNMGLT